MKRCQTCENAIFVERLGEYKCKKLYRTVTKNDEARCKDWKKGTPAVSKASKEE